MNGRFLLHVDADAFFASVVMRTRPDLRDVPMAVLAHVFVASANYPARARGVRGGTLAREALLVCPDLVLVEVPRAEVEEASDALFDLFAACALAVEPGSLEEGFLDVGDADEDSARTAGEEIRRRAAVELSLPVSVGVGRTKLIAKLASRAAKPDGLRVIGPDEEARLRATLRLDRTWGVGARTLARLAGLGVSTLGDLDRVSAAELGSVCGVGMARRLRGFRDGTDDAAVRPVRSRTSLTTEGSVAGFRRVDHTPAELLATAVARVCRRAARAGLVGTGIVLTLRAVAGGAPLVRRYDHADPTMDADLWTARARDLLDDDPPPPLTGLGVTLTGLRPAAQVAATLF